jgi:thymidylate synthase (FAD)
MKIVKPSVELVTFTPEPERLIERMGRICYQSSHKVKVCGACSGDKVIFEAIENTGGVLHKCIACNGTGTDISSAIAFVNMIKTNQHESVLEHPSASFSIICDRGVSHEIVRHRIAAYSQESTRYCNYSKEGFGSEITVVRPPDLPDDGKWWEVGMYDTEKAYITLLSQGASPQIARSVLPNSLKTEIGMTANFREWRHFLRLRTSPKAHPQMREIAEMIRTHLLRISEVCFNDIT